MRWACGGFLGGVLSITVLAAMLLLLFPQDAGEKFLPIIKLAVGIWIIQWLFLFIGHSLH